MLEIEFLRIAATKRGPGEHLNDTLYYIDIIVI